MAAAAVVTVSTLSTSSFSYLSNSLASSNVSLGSSLSIMSDLPLEWVWLEKLSATLTSTNLATELPSSGIFTLSTVVLVDSDYLRLVWEEEELEECWLEVYLTLASTKLLSLFICTLSTWVFFLADTTCPLLMWCMDTCKVG